MLIVNILLVVLSFIFLLITVRNKWVFDRMTELNRFENGIHVINSYMSYDEMMVRFWIWDVERLKKKG